MSRLGQWLSARLDGERLRRALSGAVLYGQVDQRLRVDEAVRQRLGGLVPARSVRQLWCMGGIALLLILNQAFTGLLLLKTGEPTGFGITIEFLMLASAASIVAGMFISAQSSGSTSDNASRVALSAWGPSAACICILNSAGRGAASR